MYEVIIMATANSCPGENCTTLGVDAVSLEAFDEMETDGGELIVFDVNGEDAWVQSDLYLSREAMR